MGVIIGVVRRLSRRNRRIAVGDANESVLPLDATTKDVNSIGE